MKKLSIQDIYNKCDLNLSNSEFKSTLDIEPLDDELLNQEKAKEIIDFGLSIDRYGYNIFLSGEHSSRRKTYLKKILSEKAKEKNIPDDLCYVHNFNEERKPILIQFPAGVGREFKDDMKELINKVKDEFEVLFNDRLYKKERESIEQKHDELSESSFIKYSEISRIKYKHMLDFSQDGQIYITPMNANNELLNQEQFNNLPGKAKRFYKDMKSKVGMLIVEMMDEQDKIQKNRDKALKEIDNDNAILKLDKLICDNIQKYYHHNPKIETYITNLKKDLLKNLDSFKPKENNMQSNEGISIFSGIVEDDVSDITKKYSINLLVDNTDLETAPVVFANSSYEGASLFGTSAIFVDSKGMMTTDFTHIKAGEILKANGGFLIIDSQYLSEDLWEDLKDVLKRKKLEISSRYYKSDIVLSDALNPEPIDINLKIILLGSYSTYNILSVYDDTFKELFEVHSSFDSEMTRSETNELEYLKFISKYCKDSNIKPLSKEAVERVIEYSSRVAEHQNKISLSYKSLYSILNESDLWANKSNKDIIDLDIIEKTLDYKEYMNDNYSKYRNEYLENRIILLDVEGKKVGQINGLTVFNLGDYCIGEAAKITANTFIGKSKVISIERDIEMSGSSHNKGINILTGFLNEKLNDKKCIPLTTTVTFEQNYSGIDGDSATIAEVCAILSSMSGIPINQHLAITGSMNQKGDVQAIGGVNEKIEGFHNACKTLNSSCQNGVIIPKSNIQNLMLNKNVINDMKNDNFVIYAIDRVEEAIELLLNKTLDEIITIIKTKYQS